MHCHLVKNPTQRRNVKQSWIKHWGQDAVYTSWFPYIRYLLMCLVSASFPELEINVWSFHFWEELEMTQHEELYKLLLSVWTWAMTPSSLCLCYKWGESSGHWVSTFLEPELIHRCQTIQTRVSWGKGPSIENLPPSDWPVEMSVGHFLD